MNWNITNPAYIWAKVIWVREESKSLEEISIEDYDLGTN